MYGEIAELVELKTINIFLCGENLSNVDGIRASIFKKLGGNPKYNIVYPEWIFPDLYVNNKFNIQTLEKILATHVDAIIIPLVSPATFAEASLFASDQALCKKMIVLNSREFRNSQSFINMGPLNLVAKNGGNVEWYNDREDAVSKALKIIKKIKNQENQKSNWFFYSNMILAIVTIDFPISEEVLKIRLQELNIPIDDLSFKPSINILKRKGLILEENFFKDKRRQRTYRLSENGYKHVFAPIDDTVAHKEISLLRLNQIDIKYKKVFKTQKYLENEYTLD